LKGRVRMRNWEITAIQFEPWNGNQEENWDRILQKAKSKLKEMNSNLKSFYLSSKRLIDNGTVAWRVMMKTQVKSNWVENFIKESTSKYQQSYCSSAILKLHWKAIEHWEDDLDQFLRNPRLGKVGKIITWKSHTNV